MSNSSILLVLTEEFYPINRNYYFAAIQNEILMSIVLIPNLYFLYAILKSTALEKRKIFKRTVLVFNILNIICIVTCLAVFTYYLSEYHNEGLINVNICFYLRRTQMIILPFLVTTSLVFTVERYFAVFSSNNFQKYIALSVFIIFNIPSFLMIAGMFFQSNIQWIPDEICTLIKIPTSFRINQITGSIYYLLLVIPLIVGIINFFMIKRLNLQASTNLHSKSKQNENKTVFINLIIQTLQPLFGQWPSLLFFYYLRSISNILFSIIFIKDVRNTIFRRESSKVVNKVANVIPIKTDN
uniref:G-protein coupled receptors family 1 profile domain-containing protein n=1 Tax=Strongyloides venezuelensis TaxID=75913 RepID=A0A0K0G0M5_STRVS